jgi:hypothetical protein
MHKITCDALALMTVAVCVPNTLAHAQDQSPLEHLSRQRGYLGIGVMPVFQSKTVLLKRVPVQEEIKLTLDQNRRFEEIEKKANQTIERVNANLQKKLEEYRQRKQLEGVPYDMDELRALYAEANAARTPLATDAEESKLKLLDRRQRKRLGEIQLQAEGPMAFMRPVVQQQLNMSEEQIALIGAMIDESREQITVVSALPPDLAPGGRFLSTTERDGKRYAAALEKSRTAALQVRDRTMQRILKVLTKNQRENYRKMLGEPFDLAKLRSTPASSDSKKDKSTGSAAGRLASRLRDPGARVP